MRTPHARTPRAGVLQQVGSSIAQINSVFGDCPSTCHRHRAIIRALCPPSPPHSAAISRLQGAHSGPGTAGAHTPPPARAPAPASPPRPPIDRGASPAVSSLGALTPQWTGRQAGGLVADDHTFSSRHSPPPQLCTSWLSVQLRDKDPASPSRSAHALELPVSVFTVLLE